MNDRSTALLMIAGALVGYAVYIGAHVPGMKAWALVAVVGEHESRAVGDPQFRSAPDS